MTGLLASIRGVDYRLLLWMLLPYQANLVLGFAVAFNGANLVWPSGGYDPSWLGAAFRAALVVTLSLCAWTAGSSQSAMVWRTLYRQQTAALEEARDQMARLIPAIAWAEAVETNRPDSPLLAPHRGRVTVLLTLPGLAEGREAYLEERLREAAVRSLRDLGIVVSASASVWVATNQEVTEREITEESPDVSG